MRHQSGEVQELSEWIPINLRKFKDSVRERGAGNIVELDQRDFPPEDQVERQQEVGGGENGVDQNENDHGHEQFHEAGQGSNMSDEPTGDDMDTERKTTLGFGLCT